MTKTKHAEVKQEHRELFKDIRWAKVKDPEGRPQLIADYSAEVERKARLDEARRWERFHYGQPPEGEELYWNQKRIAELGGTR